MQSLPVHGQELEHYGLSISFVIHVICIQKTWLHAGITSTIPDFIVLRHDRIDDVRGGGCAFLFIPLFLIETSVSPPILNVVLSKTIVFILLKQIWRIYLLGVVVVVSEHLKLKQLL